MKEVKYDVLLRVSRLLALLLLAAIVWDPVPGLLPSILSNDVAVIIFLVALLSMTVLLLHNLLAHTQRGWKELIQKYFFLMLAIILLFGVFYVFLDTRTEDSGLRSEYRYAPERDAFYFSAITYFTVGYGDYVPYGAAKTLSVFEAALGSIVNLIVLAIALTHLRSEAKKIR